MLPVAVVLLLLFLVVAVQVAAVVLAVAALVVRVVWQWCAVLCCGARGGGVCAHGCWGRGEALFEHCGRDEACPVACAADGVDTEHKPRRHVGKHSRKDSLEYFVNTHDEVDRGEAPRVVEEPLTVLVGFLDIGRSRGNFLRGCNDEVLCCVAIAGFARR